MFNRLFGKKRTRGRNLLLILLPFILLLGFFGFMAYKTLAGVVSSEADVKDETYEIESMNYVLRDNATEYQVELFNELAVAIESEEDNLTIAELIAENYIADFYTWTNKVGSYDVGGAYYIYTPYKPSIVLNARRTFYKYLTYYIQEFGNETLPEVTSVEVKESSINSSKYHLPYEDEDVESYHVVCEWTYNDYSYSEGDSRLTVWQSDWNKGYIKKAYFTIVKNPANDRFEIVEVWGDD